MEKNPNLLKQSRCRIDSLPYQNCGSVDQDTVSWKNRIILRFRLAGHINTLSHLLSGLRFATSLGIISKLESLSCILHSLGPIVSVP